MISAKEILRNQIILGGASVLLVVVWRQTWLALFQACFGLFCGIVISWLVLMPIMLYQNRGKVLGFLARRFWIIGNWCSRRIP